MALLRLAKEGSKHIAKFIRRFFGNEMTAIRDDMRNHFLNYEAYAFCNFCTSSATTSSTTGRFDIQTIADALPETAATLLVDTYLTDEANASSRVFRVYRPTPPHYHATCDEYLYVFSGRGTFWMGAESTKSEFKPGQLLFFKQGTVHAMPDIHEHPVVFLSIDTPRREPKDIIFIDPRDGTPATFMARNAGPE